MTYFKKHIIPYLCVTGLGVLLHFSGYSIYPNPSFCLVYLYSSSYWDISRTIRFPDIL